MYYNYRGWDIARRKRLKSIFKIMSYHQSCDHNLSDPSWKNSLVNKEQYARPCA